MNSNESRAILQTKRVLVTGATGEIGSPLVERIVSASDTNKVYLIGRHIKRSNTISGLIKKGRIEFFKCDLMSPKAISKIRNFLINEEIDVLIHLASHISTSKDVIQDAPDAIQLNILGSVHLLSCLPPTIKHIIYSSSDSVYGVPPILPVDEQCATNPFHIYGASKLATEKYLQIFAKNNDVPLSILRISAVYGPNTPKHRAIPAFITNVLQGKPPVIKGDGNTTRDYIHVDDVVQAIMLAIKHRVNGVLNIGTGEGQTIGNAAEYIIELADRKLKPIYLGGKNDYNFVFDISLAQKKLGFKPMKFIDGIRKEVEGLMATTK